MTVPGVVKGRGAWSQIGKNNVSSTYEYKPMWPIDGSEPTKDINYQAVHLAVRAIQSRLNDFRLGIALPLDGKFGPETATRVKLVQARLNEIPPYDLRNTPFTPLVVDGKVGSYTSRMMFRGIVFARAKAHKIPFKWLWGQTLTESSCDPGAVGSVSSADRGLVQINLNSHLTITVQQALDPSFALNYSAERLASTAVKFAGKGPVLQEMCTIAAHNSPVKAKTWYDTGVPPTPFIKAYVEKVLLRSTII